MKKRFISIIMGAVIFTTSFLPFSAMTAFALDSIQILDSTSNVVQDISVETNDITLPLKHALQYCAENANASNVLTIKMPAGEYKITIPF